MSWGACGSVLAAQSAAATQPSSTDPGWGYFNFVYSLWTDTHLVAHSVIAIAVVVAIGLAIGSIKFRGIGLGIAGVLFSGLALGQMGLKLNSEVFEFVREFGLILFVYTIGLQVGPGFFSSLKRNGLPLNLMAAGIVLTGATIAVIIWATVLGGQRDQLPVAVGLLSGGVTNTPSLGAAQEALVQTGAGDLRPFSSQAYAVAYPFGIMGIILTMILVRQVFRIDMDAQSKLLGQLNGSAKTGLESVNLEVKNPLLEGHRLAEVPTLAESGVVVSRVLRKGRAELARSDSILETGDILLAVGERPALERLKLIVGEESKVDVRAVPSQIDVQRILVSKPAAVGRTIRELSLRDRYGVNITRIYRAGIELPVLPNLRLQTADQMLVVGDKNSIQQVAQEVGNSPKQLDHPHLIPIFVGIFLGVVLGSIPIYLGSYFSAPVKLGLAGGPLVAALILSRIGKIGPLVWYMTPGANLMVRELGICLFLACVGIKGGQGFVETLATNGLLWMGLGAIITVTPLLIVSLIAMIWVKTNYLSLCGLLAGSMTDPPALAFATQVTGSDAPSIAYATVYPLVMLLRVLTAQLIVLIFMTQ